MSDLIDRQAAISAICNSCGKIDCDKMDKCEKLQLPPANNSEKPNSSDIIHCKDCKWFRRWVDTDIEFCDLTESTMYSTDFCSRAERREVTT